MTGNTLMENCHVPAIIVAGGKGVRMNMPMRKQYLALDGIPILAHTLRVFNACETVTHIFLVVPAKDFTFCQETILSTLTLKTPVALVPGGTTRQESVFNGLKAWGNKTGVVVIHDGVRPFVDPVLIKACVDGARKTGACILGIPVFETLKRVSGSGMILETLERKGAWLAQTPQAFASSLILSAHELALRDGFTGTDDASLLERMGEKVSVIPGSRKNIKITDPEDLALAGTMVRTL